MSDAASNPGSDPKPTTPDENKPALTAKEEEMFKIAMLKCLKSGAPEIDYQKFMEHGNFNTLKTAQNTWGKIKGKVFPKDATPKSDDGAATPTKTPKTPKAKATPRKRTKKESDEEAVGDDENANGAEKESESPKKKKKATPAKKAAKGKNTDTPTDSSAEIKREDSAVQVAKAGAEEGGDAVVPKAEGEVTADE